MRLTASKLRQDVYRIIDRVLETGVPVEIERNGRIVRLVASDAPANALDSLEPHPDAVCGDPEELVHIDWSGEWRP